MRFKYVIYPEAQQQLEQNGLMQRIKETLKKEDFPSHMIYSVMYQDTIPEIIQEMKEKGLFKNELKDYKQKLDKFFQNKDNYPWIVQRLTGEKKQKTEWEDFLLINEYLAEVVLTHKTFWAQQKFGFATSFEMHGTIGAALWQQKHGDNRGFDKGYRWQVVRKNGAIFESEITGSEHGDLRLLRTDITPYKTKEPFGNEVKYRPEDDIDYETLAAYHSTEPLLLAITLKYINQQKIPAEITTTKGRQKLLEEIAAFGQRIGNFADFGYEPFGTSAIYFATHDTPLPQLSADNETKQWSTDRIGIDGEGKYVPYIDQENNLVFAYETDVKKERKEIRFTIQPNEIDYVIKGLFVQAAKGLGRTSVSQLKKIIDYRFAPDFEEQQAYWR